MKCNTESLQNERKTVIEFAGSCHVIAWHHIATHLSAKLGNRLYEGRLADGRRPLEGSVTTLVGVEEVDEVTGVAPATEGRDGDSGADTLWTGVTLVPLTQKPSNQKVLNLYTSF